MRLSLFIARRIYNEGNRDGRMSGPAVTIAMIGIAVGLVVMILSMAVSEGFKQEIRSKVVGFASHIQVGNLNRTNSYESYPVVGDSFLIADIRQASDGVSHIQRYITKTGILKTEDGFKGILLKGIGQEYDTTFIASHLVEGEIPHFTDSTASGEILVSRQLADELNLHVGDKIHTYHVQKNVRARRFFIKGIYRTNFSEYDGRFLITDLHTVRKLNNWEKEQVSGLEVILRDESLLEQCTNEIGSLVNRQTDYYGNAYLAQNVEQLYPSLFAWLDVLDTNVWVILILMTGVAGFTMISGLLILILERTNMIGILKALGSNNLTIRQIFLCFSVFLIGKGMLWGNAIGLFLCLLQKWLGIVSLDAETYYVETVPIQIDWVSLLLLNVSTLLVSVAMMVGPSYLISRIKPAKSIRFE